MRYQQNEGTNHRNSFNNFSPFSASLVIDNRLMAREFLRARRSRGWWRRKRRNANACCHEEAHKKGDQRRGDESQVTQTSRWTMEKEFLKSLVIVGTKSTWTRKSLDAHSEALYNLCMCRERPGRPGVLRKSSERALKTLFRCKIPSGWVVVGNLVKWNNGTLIHLLRKFFAFIRFSSHDKQHWREAEYVTIFPPVYKFRSRKFFTKTSKSLNFMFSNCNKN